MAKVDWEDVAGKNNWANLLKPLENNLRQRLIQCGDRVQIIYDSINKDGLPTYTKEELFSKVGPEKEKQEKLYEVKEYIYAYVNVSAIGELIIKDKSVWIGFVAVTTSYGESQLGRKDILICWRGTLYAAEWSKNIDTSQTQPSDIFPNEDKVNVHNGFYSIYTSSNSNSTHSQTSARVQVREAVKKLLKDFENDTVSITITGHSLGAALATLNAADIVSNEYNKTTDGSQKMVTAFVFASPKVGNNDFHVAFVKLGRSLNLLRITNAYDFVPLVPARLAYTVVGHEFKFRPNGSTYTGPFVLTPSKILEYHSLTNYIEELKIDRSGRSEEPTNFAVRELANGDWELYQE